MIGEDDAAESLDTRLQDLISFCSVFPRDYEFTKDILVWQWIAGGLTQFTDDETMEKVCGHSFQTLLNMDCIIASRYDYFIDQIKYTISDKIRVQQLQNDSAKVEHLSLAFNEIDRAKQFKNLQTLIIHDCYEADHIPSHLFSELRSLKILNLSRTNISQLPNSVENLKELRFLDMSETPIGLLPESICCSTDLQTLNLDNCLQLNELPQCMSKLINLRHLVLDVGRQLQSMPVGIGKLSKLHTLSAFLVGKDGFCGIGELKNMNKLRGSLRLLHLENVATKEDAEEAHLHDKLDLTKIELKWSDNDDDDEKKPLEEKIIESLQPPSSIHELKILFYRGKVLPSWITSPAFTVLESLILHKCRYINELPSLGELPSLKCLSVVENEEVVEINDSFCRKQRADEHEYHHMTVDVAFPKLETLSFRSMSKLEKWTGLDMGDFPCLRHLVIESCPSFVGLPMLSRLSSLLRLELRRCPELSGLPEGGLPATLESWMIKECPKLKDRY